MENLERYGCVNGKYLVIFYLYLSIFFVEMFYDESRDHSMFHFKHNIFNTKKRIRCAIYERVKILFPPSSLVPNSCCLLSLFFESAFLHEVRHL